MVYHYLHLHLHLPSLDCIVDKFVQVLNKVYPCRGTYLLRYGLESLTGPHMSLGCDKMRAERQRLTDPAWSGGRR